MQEEPTIFIYTLTNPHSMEVFYVGQSVNLIQRRASHGLIYGNRWEKSLPIIEEVDRCYFSERMKVEGYWISQFHAWGFKLKNRYIPGITDLSRCGKRTPSGVRVVKANFKECVLKSMSENEAAISAIKEYFGITSKTATKWIANDHVNLSQYGIIKIISEILGASSYEQLLKQHKDTSNPEYGASNETGSVSPQTYQ